MLGTGVGVGVGVGVGEIETRGLAVAEGVGVRVELDGDGDFFTLFINSFNPLCQLLFNSSSEISEIFRKITV